MPSEVAVPAGTSPATPAPSSPTSGTPASAPATSAIATTPTTTPASERPNEATPLGPTSSAKDIANFLKAGDAAADATTPQSPLVADPAAAPIAQPTEPIKAGAVDPSAAKAPVPFDVHHSALANARTKAVAEFKQQLGPLAELNPQQRTFLIDAATRMQDPVAFHQWFGEQLRSSPKYSQQLTAPPTNTKPQPDVQIHDGNGNVVGMSYSAAASEKLLEWERTQLEGKFTQMLKPFQDERTARLDQERTDKEQAFLNEQATTVQTRIEKILRLDSLPEPERASIRQKFLDETSRTPNLIEAAITVFERDIVPGLEAKGKQAALDTNLKKAAGNTVSGSTAAATPTLGPNSTQKEIAAFLRQGQA